MDVITVLEIFAIVILFILVIFVFRRISSKRKEKRIAYYSLEPLRDNSLSTFDKISNKYMSFVRRMRPYMKKVRFFEIISKKYEKYIKYKNREEIVAIDFISNKIIISITFLLFTMFSKILMEGNITLLGAVINYFIGYFLLDIFLFIDYKKKTKLIENELLRAIIIMNNAFKSGKSTLQALKIASEELPEPINDEFKKMYLDMKYGLSVDTVFDRFSKRVNLEEAVYLSSSLTILNRTGGNIIEVFSSIERTLFDKKKLNEELKNISASPSMIVKVLFIVPIVFTLFIYILNPDYFSPLFESVLGYIIIAIIIVMFVIYIILLKRILKIEV